MSAHQRNQYISDMVLIGAIIMKEILNPRNRNFWWPPTGSLFLRVGGPRLFSCCGSTGLTGIKEILQASRGILCPFKITCCGYRRSFHYRFPFFFLSISNSGICWFAEIIFSQSFFSSVSFHQRSVVKEFIGNPFLLLVLMFGTE